MQLPSCPLSWRVATHRRLTHQPWHIHHGPSQGFAQSALAAAQWTQKKGQKPWKSKSLLRDHDISPTLLRQNSGAGSGPLLDINKDEAFRTALMNLTISKPEDAPPMDYSKTSTPPTVKEVCDTYGLAYPEGRKTGYSALQGLEFSLSKKHCFSDYHMRDIADVLSPLHDARLDMAVERHEKEPLWLNVYMVGGGKKIMPVVKTRAAKRLKHAFYEALRRNGYDKHGNPLSMKEAQEAGTEPARERLYGTVRCKVLEPRKMASCDYVGVVKFWEERIVAVIRHALTEGRAAPRKTPKSNDMKVRKAASHSSTGRGAAGRSWKAREGT